MVLIREDLKVYPFADVISRQHFLLSYFKTLCVAQAGVEFTTSRERPNAQPTESPVRSLVVFTLCCKIINLH